MSGREWKPGDVAVRRSIHGDECLSWVVSAPCFKHEYLSENHWHHQDGGFDSFPKQGSQWEPTYRSVLVLDPADLAPLWNEYQGRRERGVTSHEALQQAVDALANPAPAKPAWTKGDVVQHKPTGGVWTRRDDHWLGSHNGTRGYDDDFDDDDAGIWRILRQQSTGIGADQ